MTCFSDSVSAIRRNLGLSAPNVVVLVIFHKKNYTVYKFSVRTWFSVAYCKNMLILLDFCVVVEQGFRNDGRFTVTVSKCNVWRKCRPIQFLHCMTNNGTLRKSLQCSVLCLVNVLFSGPEYWL